MDGTQANKQENAIRYLLSFKEKNIEETAFRANLVKPLLLDNPSQILTFAQINQKNFNRKQMDQMRQLVPRYKRRKLLRPLASRELENKLVAIWKQYTPKDSLTSFKFEAEVNLLGCWLCVDSSKTRVLPSKYIIEGVVIRETSQVLHLSNSARNKVFCVPKKDTVFRYEQIQFQRYYKDKNIRNTK